MKTPDLEQITMLFLAENGYDGLFNGKCACLTNDLMPCGNPQPQCTAGYKVKYKCGDRTFHVQAKKP